MIQIYKRDNTNFEANGDRVLFPFVCTLQMELNGNWELTIEHPIDDDSAWKLITREAVLCVPTPISERQLFRIYNTIAADHQVTAYAKPIFMDSVNDVFLLDKSAALINGQQALNILTQGTKYKGSSNIKNTATSFWNRKNLIEALASDDENSFLNQWGGEILFDNYTILLNERAGGDYGTTIRTGKNLTGIKEDINTDEVITRIVPVAYNGYMLKGTQPWVDSPLINNYAVVYTREVKFDDVRLTEDAGTDEEGTFDTLEELRKELTRRSDLMFSEKQVDRPKVTLDIEMIDLANTEEYKDYAILEKVNLGDTVHCIHSKLGIETAARIINIEWDCIGNKSLTLTIGDAEYSYLSDVTKNVNAVQKMINTENNTLMAERVAGILDAMNTQLRYQKDVAQRQDVRAILFEDLDKTSPIYGAMCLGTQGLEISNKRTSDDRDWDWSTAATANGIYADAILTGLLSDRKGYNYWDLDTGEFYSKAVSTAIEETDGKFGKYSTTIEMNSVISQRANEISIEVTEKKLKDYATASSVNESISKINLQINSITSEVSKKVNGENFGTLIEQNYQNVRIAWNNNSKYLQFDPGALSIYDGSVIESKRRARFDEDGNHFYRDNNYIGKIGTNQYASNTSLKGLEFDMRHQGAYMTWAAMSSSSDTEYKMKFTYANKTVEGYTAGRLHAGCILDMHNYQLLNIKAANGYTGWTGTIPIVTNIENLSDGRMRWYTSTITVSNGIITSAPN